MSSSPKVLIADDDASIRLVLSHAFARAGFQVRATGAPAALMKWAADGEGDLIVSDVLMPDENMLEVLPRLRRLRPQLPIILMSAQNTLLTAVAAAERGAFEYMPKPFDLDEMIAAARRALASSETVVQARLGRDAQLPLIGRSPAMQQVYRALARLVGSPVNVLITGESGSGKSLAARVLHQLGPRRDTPLVEVSLAGLSGAEIERKLVGVDGQSGGLQAAGQGVLLLDEVGDLEAEAQARLLGLIDRIERQSGPRLIATTSQDLSTLVAQGAFRADLFFRLAVAPLRMPPLRERTEDVGELARAFLLRAQEEGAPAKVLEPEALARLEGHGWPGNVRELENLMRRVALLHAGAQISPEALEAELSPGQGAADSGPVTIDGRLAEAVRAAFAGPPPAPGVHERMMSALERPLLTAALAACGGNQLRAAELLGLNRNTLRKRLSDLGLRPK